MSKYDRPDPSLSADYCDGLSAEPEPECNLCAFCNAPIVGSDDYYCSSLCAALAERDNNEDRP